MIAKQILVVDDSSLVRNLIQTLLTAEGHKVHEAQDGLQAVARMKETAYDLILSDIQMPHLDGMGVLEEARRLQPKARVILMSGMEPNLAKIRNRGAFGFIQKPFSLKFFHENVERCLEASEPAAHKPVTAG